MAEKFNLMLDTKVEPGTLITNFKELKTVIDAQMAKYKSYVATEDNLTVVKAELAKIRAFQRQMDANFKSIDKEYNFPLNQAKILFDDLLSSVKIAEGILDVQVKAIEKDIQGRFIEERKDQFKKRIKEESLELQKYISECKSWIIPANWKNKSLTQKAVTDYIEKTISDIKTAYEAFKDHMYKDDLLKHFSENGDFQQTFGLMKEKEAEYEKAQRLSLKQQELMMKGKEPVSNQSLADESPHAVNGLYHGENSQINKPTIEIVKQDSSVLNPKVHVVENIVIPEDEIQHKVSSLAIVFSGERYKIQAILDIAKNIGLKRERG